MPELRKDPVIGRWTIFSPERARRPSALRVENVEEFGDVDGSVCPFCPGHEDKTPPEVYAIRNGDGGANGPGWDVRVVPNQFPALRVEGDLEKAGDGIYDMMTGIGAHEVIIETPDHERGIEHHTAASLAQVFEAYKCRLLDLSRDQRFRYILLFKNAGALAGASLGHSHSQLIATPVTPILVRSELHGARDYFNYKDRCVFCDVIRQEREQRIRIVAENDGVIALCPYAARFPFEVRIYPKRHSADFHTAAPEEYRALAEVVIMVMRKLRTGLGNPHYNWVLHTAPVRFPHVGYWQTLEQDYHWHLEIMPKLSIVAGFEWGSGFYINPTLPEDAAAFLRDVRVE